MKAEWIIIRAGSADVPPEMECERCGTIKRIRLPLSVEKFLARSREFCAAHAGCEEAVG
jgi:hypothetical protein